MDIRKRALLVRRMEELCARMKVLYLRMKSVERDARLGWMRAVLVNCEAKYNRANNMIIFDYGPTFEEFLLS